MKKYFNIKLIVTLLILVSILVLTIVSCNKPSNSKIPITTNSEIARVHYKQGLDLLEKLRRQDAVYYFLKAVAEDEKFAMGNLMLSYAIAQDSPDRYFKYLNRAVELVDDVSEGERLWILAGQALSSGDTKQAEEYYKQLIQRYPNDEWGYNLLANLYFGMQEYDSAITYHKKALEINPEFSQPYNMLGYSYRNLGDYMEAEKYFIKYIDLIDDEPNPYDSYAELLYKMGKFESSIEYYRKALEMKPDFLASITGIAANLNLLNRHAEAIEELDKISQHSSQSGDLRNMNIHKAVSYVDKNDYDSALKVLKENSENSLKNEDYISLGQDYYYIGLLNLLFGKTEQALFNFERAIEYFDISDISQEVKYNVRRGLFYNAGLVAFVEQDTVKLKNLAEKYTEETKKANNQNQIRNSHDLTGLLFLLEEKYQQAVNEFQKGNSQDPVAIYYKGLALEGLDDTSNAAEAFRKSANFNPLPNMAWAFIRHLAQAKLDSFN